LAGHVPDKLTELEAEPSVAPTAVEGASLRAALKGDCHAHSTWSDGGASISAMARAAQALGHEYLVMTDHSPRLTIAHGLNGERLRAQLEEVARLNEELAPFRILTGIEVDILVDGALDQSEEMLGQLDVVVASVHSKLSMPANEMTERLVLAVSSPYVDILGHCTGRLVPGPGGKGRKGSQFDASMVFAACQMFDTAVEINCRPERQDPPEELLVLAVEWGCNIVISTDAHSPGQMEWQAFGCEKAERCGVPVESIINTWSADELVAWTATHPTF
jgi:putative hydrolase